MRTGVFWTQSRVLFLTTKDFRNKHNISSHNSLNGSLNGMKDSWGLLAVFNDKLEAVKHDIEECTKELDLLQKQLNEASTDLKNPKAKKSMSITELDADVRNMRTKTNELNKKGEKITKDLQDLSKKQ